MVIEILHEINIHRQEGDIGFTVYKCVTYLKLYHKFIGLFVYTDLFRFVFIKLFSKHFINNKLYH